MASIKEIIRDRLRNYAFAIVVLVVVASVSIILLILKLPEGWEWVDILANSTLGAVIGAALVDVVCSIADGKEAEEDMRKGIMETLCSVPDNNEKPQLYTLYKKQAIEPILQQCMTAYCASPQLSLGYLSYIKNSCSNLKKKETYRVTVERMDCGTQYIRQSLKHTAIFRPNIGERPCFQAYFIFKDRASLSDHQGALDKVMSDKSYFFREDLTDDGFVQELIDIKLNAEASGEPWVEDVLSKLKFTVDLFNNEKTDQPVRIKPAEYQVVFDSDMVVNPETGKKEENYYGLKIKTLIPDEYVIASDHFFNEEGFVQYTACMNTRYRVPESQNTFYVVYALPTIKSHFSITFDMGIRNFVKKVDYMTFMTIDQSAAHDDEHDGIMEKRGNTFTFNTSRTVFPRSGMSFTWDGMNV